MIVFKYKKNKRTFELLTPCPFLTVLNNDDVPRIAAYACQVCKFYDREEKLNVLKCKFDEYVEKIKKENG